MDKIVAFIVASIGGMGYIGIVLLMALESSFFPFPSEVVVPPAGYLASQGEMNIFLVILSGILGSILGAFVNYYIAYKYGRNLLITYGKYFFINEEKFKKIESFFITHGEISTFVGRLIPGVRQYISFPAGLAKMNLTKFIFYTALGAGIWVVILAYVGYFIGNNIELIREKLHIITIIIIPFIIIIIMLYIYINKKKKKA
ncbi:DedA family protein [Deferribacterales bacterium Es71-Z0220]|uniref:DedA family protein n=1 Tax=Deferrivibrio essentukiensis TaxID=2880922 RepID=UPI001F6029F0|nr:DedA family protein [Deferrivibrio essentukiensis]MCB4204449.1 DedA family protein [Deferrivibrio essentukiensis]